MKWIPPEELSRVTGGRHRRGGRRHHWGPNRGHCHQHRYPDGSGGTPCG